MNKPENKFMIDWQLHHIRYKLETLKAIDLDFLSDILIDETLLREFKDKVLWGSVLRHKQLTSNFLRELVTWNDDLWDNIACYQKLSEDFIDEYKDKLQWIYLSSNQRLSEKFMEKHLDYLDWIYVSQYQKLSPEFMKKYENKLDWNCVLKYQKNIPGYLVYKHKNETSTMGYLNAMRRFN